MADEIDKANDYAEIAREDAMAKRKPEGPVATGECLYCGERLPKPMRWCDASCRNDWQETQRA